MDEDMKKLNELNEIWNGVMGLMFDSCSPEEIEEIIKKSDNLIRGDDGKIHFVQTRHN